MQKNIEKSKIFKNSHELYKKACEIIPGGVNSPVRAFKAVGLEPIFISKGQGPYLWDADNNKYIDFVCSWGALINGHAHPKIIKALEEVIPLGTSYGAPHENEIELCQIITERFPSIKKIRLVNSGTEAVMTAIRLARAYTSRNKIIKFEGCYHGHSDGVLSQSGSGIATFGIPSSPGVTKNTACETVTLPYNNSNLLEITLSKYPNDFAAIIVEPVIGNSGVIEPQANFLKRLRELCTKFNCILIFDEIITGFRISAGGAQEKYNITPDLTTLGKIIGGGLPIGAVGGKSKIMDLLAPDGPVYQAGTLSGNPLSVACGIANLKLLNKDSYNYLEKLTENLCEEIQNFNEKKGLKIHINRVCSMFTVFFTKNIVVDYASAKTSNTKTYAMFFQNMLLKGFYLAPSQFEANFISISHKEEDIEKMIKAYKDTIENIF